MYRMLVVEEEQFEREALGELIDWPALGVDLSCSVETAEEAVNLSLASGFDILLTNIRLPGMPGIDLARMMLERYPRLKVIFNGSTGDIETALQAFGPDACSFIAKPISLAELKTVASRVVRELNEEREQPGSAERLKQLVREKLPGIRRHFFERLVSGSLSDAEIIKNLDYFGMNAVQGRFVVLLCEIDGFDRQSAILDWERLQMMLESIGEAVLNLKLENLMDFYYLDRGRFAALLCLRGSDPKNDARQVYSAAELIRGEATVFCGGSVTVGTGCTVDRIRDIRQSFRSAAVALAWKFTAGKGQVISHADAALPEFEHGQPDMGAIEEALVLSVETANAAEARNIVDRLFNSAKRWQWNEKRMYVACVRLLSRLLMLLHDLGESDERVFQGGEVWGKLLECGAIPEMRSLMDKCVADAVSQMLARRGAADRNIVLRILDYIEKHMEGRITAAELADEFHCSPNHIGVVFRKDTGKTLTDYVKDVRLERARDMLKNPANRIGEVAIKVGYPNVSYFCSLFRKKYGVNPGEYKEKA